jgi:MFS family permease
MTNISKERKEKLESNIWKYYAYRILCSFTFTWPIFVLFLQERGLSATQIMLLQAWYTLIILVLQIPAGIITDHIGTKKMMVFNSFFYAVAFIAYGLSNNIYHLMIAEALFAISVATWVASGQPFIYNTLKELKQEGRFKKIYGTARAIESISLAIGAMLGSYFALHSLRTPFLLSAVPTFIGLIITFWFVNPRGYAKADGKYFAHLKDAVKFVANQPRVRFFIIFVTILSGVFWSVGFFTQPYYKMAGLPVEYFGIAYAIMLLGSAVAARYVHELEALLGEKLSLTIMVAIPIICYFTMGKTVALFAIAIPIIVNIVWQFQDILIADYVNRHVESHHRATVTSLQASACMVAETALGPIAGVIADAHGIQASFSVAAIVLLPALALLLIVFYIAHRKTKKQKPSVLA